MKFPTTITYNRPQVLLVLYQVVEWEESSFLRDDVVGQARSWVALFFVVYYGTTLATSNQPRSCCWHSVWLCAGTHNNWFSPVIAVGGKLFCLSVSQARRLCCVLCTVVDCRLVRFRIFRVVVKQLLSS